MAYNLDYTRTADLLAAYKQERPVTTFLKDRYFADGENFATDEVLIEYKKGLRKLAPFVSPMINGKVLARAGYQVKAFRPAMIQPKRTLSIDTLARKGFGEAYYNQLTPAERAVQMTVDDLHEMRDSIDLRKEAMAAEVLQKNALVMKYYNDNNELTDTKHLSFFEGNNTAVYTVENKWNTADADIFGDLEQICDDLENNGCAATEVIVGANVAKALFDNEKIQKALDNRRMEVGEWQPSTLYKEVSRLAHLNIFGHELDFIKYNGSYENENGVLTPFIDRDSIVVLAPGCGVTNYGAITQIDYGSADFTTYVEKEVPLYEVKDQTRSVILKSAPLLQPKNLAPMRVAKVL